MKLNVQGHLKCWLWRLASLLWAEKMSMTMLVLVARALQQPMKRLKQWSKWFWISVESLLERLLMIHVRLMPSNFYGCFKDQTCGNEDCSKIAKNNFIWTSLKISRTITDMCTNITEKKIRKSNIRNSRNLKITVIF